MTNTINELDGLRITPAGTVERQLRADRLSAGDPIFLDDGFVPEIGRAYIPADIVITEAVNGRVRIVAQPRSDSYPVREITPLESDPVLMPSRIASTISDVIALTRQARAWRARRAVAAR